MGGHFGRVTKKPTRMHTIGLENHRFRNARKLGVGGSGSRKGGLSKGAFCAKQTFLQGNGLPSAVLQGNGLPSAVVTRHPPRPWKVSPEPTRAQ